MGLSAALSSPSRRFYYHSTAFAAEAIAAIRDRARVLGIDAGHGVTLNLTGPAVLDQEELESVSSGAFLASVLTTVAVAALLVWGLGSWRLIAATLFTLPVGLIATAALATLMIGRLNLISVTFAVLFVGFGVDFGIHLALRYREALNRQQQCQAALQEAVIGVGNAFSLSAFCAIIGFLAFVPTDYLGLAELGIISAGGMAIAWFMSLTLLPALLCLMPLRPQETLPLHRPRLLPAIERHSRAVLAVTGLLGLAALVLVPRLEFDFNPLHLKDPASKSMRTLQALAADGTSTPYMIEIVAPDLDQANRIATQVEALEVVAQAITLQSSVTACTGGKTGADRHACHLCRAGARRKSGRAIERQATLSGIGRPRECPRPRAGRGPAPGPQSRGGPTESRAWAIPGRDGRLRSGPTPSLSSALPGFCPSSGEPPSRLGGRFVSP